MHDLHHTGTVAFMQQLHKHLRQKEPPAQVENTREAGGERESAHGTGTESRGLIRETTRGW